MAPTTHLPRGEERRAHPRHERRLPLTIQSVGRGPIAAETIDVSIGGTRVRSSSRLPLGPCDIVLAAEPDDRLVVTGTVVEEVLDASTGEVTARIVFDRGVSGVAEQLAARLDRKTLVARRRGIAVVAAGVAIVVGGVVAALALSGGDEPTRDPVSTAAPTPDPADRQPSPADAPATPAPSVPTTVVTPTPTAPPATAAPAPTPTPAAPAPAASAPAASPTPAATPVRAESADNFVSVILGTTSEDTAVSSSMGPSQGVDPVRVQLHVTPEPQGTALPVAVTVENRGTDTLRFPDGLQAVVTATRDGAEAGTTTLTAADITEVAPGQRVVVEGMLDFGATGEYDVAAQVDVAG